jgi:thiopurine S-methyltransferase
MEPEFWHQRWEEKAIGFHEKEANPLLVKHFDRLGLGRGARVFVPLCGKTLDIAWLAAQGCGVVGVELSPIAVQELFDQDLLAGTGAEPEIAELGKLTRYSTANIEVFVGDLFDLAPQVLGKVDAVYDRAALVALPGQMRRRYTAHLMDITNRARQLLITFDYDQAKMDGPPFSVPADEVHRHYDRSYQVSLLESRYVAGGLKGQVAATENVWLLERR